MAIAIDSARIATRLMQIFGGLKRFLEKLRVRAFSPIDIASLVFFRIAFGLLMVWESWHWIFDGSIAKFWLRPRFLFKYYGFSWVEPWPGNGLYVHCAVLGILALFVAAGFLYRANATLFFIGYAYTFLLDEALWVNHTYLICLFGFLLIFIPADRALSVDAWLKPKIYSRTTPAWALWLLRGQIGMVYFFAGLAKIAPDWLRGAPMRARLAVRPHFPIVGRFFHEEWMVYATSYGSLLFDLLIVPLLLWRRTRVAAFWAAVVFHLLNFRLFDIGVFPWLAIGATTLFLSPSWPRRLIALFARASPVEPDLALNERQTSIGKQWLVLSLVMIYLAIQFLVPLRHLLSPGGLEWKSVEHRFSWRMMLIQYAARAFFYVTDPNSGEVYQVPPTDYLRPYQAVRMCIRPDMMVQFAQYLAKVMPRSGPKPLRVEVRVYVSINGRKPQLLVDPNINLAAEPPPFGRPRWLLRIDEPLPASQQPDDESPDAWIEQL